MDGGLVGVVEWEELEKSKVANVCVSVVAVYRARVCRSRRYRRLHRAGYSNRAAAWRGVTNGRRPGNLGYVKSATQNHFFCGGPDTFCVDDNNAPLLCERAPRVVSLSSPAYYSRRAADGMPTHRISRERRVQSVHGLIESQAHYFLLPLTHSLPPRSPSPSLPFLPAADRRTDCVGLPVM